MSHKPLGQYPGFYDNDPRYRCCCRSMHSRIGVIVLAVFGILGVISDFIGLFVDDTDSKEETGSKVFSLIIFAACAIGLILALTTEKKGFLLPELVCSIFSIVGLVIVFIVFIVFIIWPQLPAEVLNEYFDELKNNGTEVIIEKERTQSDKIGAETLIRVGFVLGEIAVLLLIWITYWQFDFVRKYYYYLRDKRAAIQMA